jgi:hypothetical protein
MMIASDDMGCLIETFLRRQVRLKFKYYSQNMQFFTAFAVNMAYTAVLPRYAFFIRLYL